LGYWWTELPPHFLQAKPALKARAAVFPAHLKKVYFESIKSFSIANANLKFLRIIFLKFLLIKIFFLKKSLPVEAF